MNNSTLNLIGYKKLQSTRQPISRQQTHIVTGGSWEWTIPLTVYKSTAIYCSYRFLHISDVDDIVYRNR